MALELEYELKDRNLFTPLTDALFIRRALRDSLKRTLLRFARERRRRHAAALKLRRTTALDPRLICRCRM